MLLYAISSSTIILSKFLLNFCSPVLLTCIRTGIAGIILLSYAAISRNISGFTRHFFTLLQIGLCSFFLSNIIKFFAIKHISSSKAALLATTEPLFAAILAYFMFSESLNLKQGLGMLLAIFGSLALSFSFTASYTLSWVDAFIILSVIASSYGALLMRKLIKYENCSVSMVNGISMLFGAVISLFSLTGFDSINFQNAHNWWAFVGALAIMILVSNIFGYQLYGSLLKRHSVAFISCASFTRPIFTSLYNAILFGEKIHASSLISFFIIILGLAIFYACEIQETKKNPRLNIN